MKKNIFSIFIAVIVSMLSIFSITACGKSKNSAEESTEDNSVQLFSFNCKDYLDISVKVKPAGSPKYGDSDFLYKQAQINVQVSKKSTLSSCIFYGAKLVIKVTVGEGHTGEQSITIKVSLNQTGYGSASETIFFSGYIETDYILKGSYTVKEASGSIEFL